MKDGWIKVAAANFAVKVADVKSNVQSMAEQAQALAGRNVRLIVFPELSLTGGTAGDLYRQRALQDQVLRGLRDLAAQSLMWDCAIVVGAPLVRGNRLYDCAVVVYGGEILGVVPNRAPSDPRFSTFAGTGEIVLDGMTRPFGSDLTFACDAMESFVLGVEIGEPSAGAYDRFVALARRGASVIANPRVQMQSADLPERLRAQTQAITDATLSAVIVSCALDESTGDAVYGGCKCIAEAGRVLAASDPFHAAATVADVDTEYLAVLRDRCDTFGVDTDAVCVRMDMPIRDTRLTREYAPDPYFPTDAAAKSLACARMLQMQAYGLAKRMRHSKTQKLVVGVSGGSDSTLTMIVCALALDVCKRDRGDLIAITMPAFGTTGRTRANAETLSRALGAQLETVDITRAVRQHFADIGQSEDCRDAAYENAQARERTQVLMDYANRVGGIVVGTGDMSESALGWATYNGDHMSMYNPNASLTKTAVRELIAFYASKCSDRELQAVLTDILDTPISPELLPSDGDRIGQITEDIVGPYALHDFVLYWGIGYGFAPRKIFRMARSAFAGRYDAKTIAHWMQVFYGRFFAQQFKRSCSPDGAQIGGFSLSPRGGWRMPSDAVGALWIEQAAQLER